MHGAWKLEGYRMTEQKQRAAALVGSEAEIFEDPFTRKNSEGRAVIVTVVKRGTEDDCEWADCWVRFIGDAEDEQYYRTIAYI